MSRHIDCSVSQIAPYVLISGDPLRTKYMAHKFLTAPQLVSRVRNNLIFTGTYQNIPITFATSGIGIGSTAIYAQELIVDYHVQAIIRMGSAGSYDPALNLYDLVLVKRAHGDFIIWPEIKNSLILAADHKLNTIISTTAKQLQLQLPQVDAHSTLRFYTQTPAQIRISNLKKGVSTVEMESYALFALGLKFNCATACLLTISDLLFPVPNQQRTTTTPQERTTGVTAMFRLGLASLVAFSKTP